MKSSVALWSLLLATELCVVTTDCGFAATFRALHAFAGHADGAHPYGGVLLDSAGNLFGTTSAGGAANKGTVFELAPDGTHTVLYSFHNYDGRRPTDGVISDTAGNLYGTTFWGGYGSGNGTIFKLASDGTETVLYAFRGGNDGAIPVGGLIMDASGNLYGTTESAGGTSCGGGGCGIVFKIAQNGTETILHRFSGGKDGESPYSAVAADAAGNLYGTTSQGGRKSCSCGTVYKVTPDGSETILHRFTGEDGQLPYSDLIIDKAGNLYGTTYSGGAHSGGVVYKVTAGGSETVLYSFVGVPDGAGPIGGLAMDGQGNLYGTAAYGGDLRCHDADGFGCGTVFKLAPNGSFEVLHTFHGKGDGRVPYGDLILDNQGNIYGTTTEGDASAIGVVFEISP